MLKFNKVSFKYKDENKEIIKNLSFSLQKGDFVNVVGSSDCGKSTIFRLITGLEKLSEGSIFFNRNNIEDNKVPIEYMPQKDLLLPRRTILENICLPLEINGVSRLKAKNQAEEFKKIFLYMSIKINTQKIY